MADPIIEDWYVYPAAVGDVLVGRVAGHPTIPDGPITTSAITEIGDDWARTMNRNYRLGQPHGSRRTWLAEFLAQPGEPVPLPTPEQTLAFMEEMATEGEAYQEELAKIEDTWSIKP